MSYSLQLAVLLHNVKYSKILQKYLKKYIHNNYIAMTLKSSSYFKGVRLYCTWVILDTNLKFHSVLYK